MNLCRQFVRNAGRWGTAQMVVVSIAVILLVIVAFAQGHGPYTLLGVVIAVGLGYALRNRLASNPRITQYAMNACAVLMIIFAYGFPEMRNHQLSMQLWPILVAFYLSCYFFLMSHPDITTQV